MLSMQTVPKAKKQKQKQWSIPCINCFKHVWFRVKVIHIGERLLSSDVILNGKITPKESALLASLLECTHLSSAFAWTWIGYSKFVVIFQCIFIYKLNLSGVLWRKILRNKNHITKIPSIIHVKWELIGTI